MSSVLKALVKITGVKLNKGEDRQEYLNRLVTAVDGLGNAEWDDIPDESQEWFNAAAKAAKAEEEIDDPEPVEKSTEEPKAVKKPTKPEADEDEADEDEADEDEADEDEADEDEADEDEEDEVVPVKPAKAKSGKKSEKKSKVGPSVTNQFYTAFVKAYVKNSDVQPSAVIEKTGLTVTPATANTIAYATKRVIGVLRAAKLLQ